MSTDHASADHVRGVLTGARVEELAARLDAAERDRAPMSHFSAEFAGMTLDDAYAVQQAWVDTKLARGQRVVGHKVGLTSRPMQRGAGIEEPDYGVLLDQMMFDDGAAVPAGRFVAPRVEMELAFLLARTLPAADCTVADVLRAADFVVPALEIIDTRFHRVDPVSGSVRTIVDTVSDNAANGAVVVGGRPVRPTDVDLRWVGAILTVNGIVEQTGLSAAVLNHPARGVAWLANTLGARGTELTAGQLVLSGSFAAAVPVVAGDVVHADYRDLGTITCRFTGDA